MNPSDTQAGSGSETLERSASAAKLALALDVDDLVAARRLAIDLAPYFGVAKVGMELYAAVGPEVIAILADLGYEVFLDLKLLDIPTSVERTARVLGALGAGYLTLHAFGGVPMLSAGVRGLQDGATGAGLDAPMAVAVTVLTSDDGAPPHIIGKRATTAVEAGCGGIVCASDDLVEARQIAPRLAKIVPGIRLEGGASHDQARPATPRSAIDAGADLLVIGRAVTAADNPIGAAEAIVADLA